MKHIQSIAKNNRLLRLIAVCAVIISINLFPLHVRTEQGKMAAQTAAKRMQQLKQHQNQYFICEQGTNNGIWVDKAVVENNSEMIKNMVAETGGKDNRIELPFSIDIIKLAFDHFNKKVSLRDLPLEQLVPLFNIEDYLLVPHDSLKCVFRAIYAIVRKTCAALRNYACNLVGETIDDINDDCLGSYVQSCDCDGYRGEIIPIVPEKEMRRYNRIPNYKLLAGLATEPRDLKEEEAMKPTSTPGSIFQIFLLPSYMNNRNASDKQIKQDFINNRMVDFVDALLKPAQERIRQTDERDALIRRKDIEAKKWFWQ